MRPNRRATPALDPADSTQYMRRRRGADLHSSQVTPREGKSYVPGIAVWQPARSWCELQLIWSSGLLQHRRQKRFAAGSTLDGDAMRRQPLVVDHSRGKGRLGER